jgi:hypothetical protein
MDSQRVAAGYEQTSVAGATTIVAAEPSSRDEKGNVSPTAARNVRTQSVPSAAPSTSSSSWSSRSIVGAFFLAALAALLVFTLIEIRQTKGALADLEERISTRDQDGAPGPRSGSAYVVEASLEESVALNQTTQMQKKTATASAVEEGQKSVALNQTTRMQKKTATAYAVEEGQTSVALQATQKQQKTATPCGRCCSRPDKSTVALDGSSPTTYPGDVFVTGEASAFGHMVRSAAMFAAIRPRGAWNFTTVVITSQKGPPSWKQQHEAMVKWFVTVGVQHGVTLEIVWTQSDERFSLCSKSGLVYVAMEQSYERKCQGGRGVAGGYNLPSYFQNRAVASGFRTALKLHVGVMQKPLLPGVTNVLVVQRGHKRAFSNVIAIETALKAALPASKVQVTSSLAVLPYKAQLQLFADADIVVMAHGAGLINAVAMREDTLLIECFPPGFLWTYFWPFLDHLGIRHDWYEAPSGGCGGCKAASGTMHSEANVRCRDCPINVDPRALVDKVKAGGRVGGDMPLWADTCDAATAAAATPAA